ncbi:hypothetical protein BKA65DRAFT_92278 [Rhexocercosporidium sp. MPI-PUGE-AT-0058]|nr:hypothetical protein BKA65DRAFT_92278 [Rhexocercosporidium sp. MPI-PUGE-AT-0058]
MDFTSDSSLEWELAFEPDQDAEEELAGEEDGTVDKALITDETIRKCRILASVQSIEYGETEVTPGQTKPAALLVINFHFHPFESRVKGADVELAFNNKATIALLQPESINDSESEETIRHKLYAELSIGYPPAGVDAKAGSERETERTKKFAERIRGSGISSSRATWTLRENPQARDGIHLRFVGVLVIKAEGELEVDVEIRATIGAKLDDPLGIRKIIATQTKKFDGKSLLGRRPLALDIEEGLFKANGK